MYGPEGIGKTSSIILYCYLSSFITDYEIEYDHSIDNEISRIFYLSFSDFRN